MNCKNCGAQLYDGDTICRVCGTSIYNQNNINQQAVNNSFQQAPVQPTPQPVQSEVQSYNQVEQPVQQFNPLEPPYQNNNITQKYKLTLHRKKSFVGSMVSLDVNIDNQKVGTIKNGETIELEITPGNHTIFLSKKNLLVSVDPNNAVNIQVNGNVTADVVLFGANNFGITNINGQGVNPSKESTQNYFEKNTKKSNIVLLASVIIPIISLLLFIFKKLYIAPWVYGIIIGYAVVNLAGLKLQKNSKNYKSNLLKNILVIVLSIIVAFATMYIKINKISSIDELLGKNNSSYKDEEYEEEVEDIVDEKSDSFDLKYNIPDNFKLEDSYQDSTTKDSYYLYKNTKTSGNFYSIEVMKLNSMESQITTAASIREALIEALKEETNNVSDFKYEYVNIKSKTINGNVWSEYIDKATSNSMNLKVTIFIYIINHGKSTYAAYGVIKGDISSAEPAYSNFINSLNFNS